jgi:hypothetical protein
MNREHESFAKLRTGLADLVMFYPKIYLIELTMMLECRCRIYTVTNCKNANARLTFLIHSGINFSL